MDELENTDNKPQASRSEFSHRAIEVLFLGLIFFAVFLLVALLNYDMGDPGWSQTSSVSIIQNSTGYAGAILADLFLYFFGYTAYLIPFCIAAVAWLIFSDKQWTFQNFKLEQFIQFFIFMLLLLTFCVLLTFNVLPSEGALPVDVPSGGMLGKFLSLKLLAYLGFVGSTLLLVTLFLICTTLLLKISWLGLMDWLGKQIENLYCYIKNRFQNNRSKSESLDEVEADFLQDSNSIDAFEPATEILNDKKPPVFVTDPLLDDNVKEEPKFDLEAELIEPKKAKRQPKIKIPIEDLPVTESFDFDEPEQPLAGEETVVKPRKKNLNPFKRKAVGAFPSTDLLDVAEQKKQGFTKQQLQDLADLLEIKLKDYRVTAEVVAIHPGPVITRFELMLAPGIKVSTVNTIGKDIARSLSVQSVRIVDVIPGKSTIGIEIPNEVREMVRLRELLESDIFQGSKSPLTMALGKDISGKVVIDDLGKMPHLLVAGTTGSGKSVAVNVMLLSILYKSSYKDVKMILIDPKMLELNVYDGIPHLLTPVVTDMKEASNALRWCVAEMERRYKLMSTQKVRNIAGFNVKVNAAIAEGTPIKDPLYKKEEAFDPDLPHPTLEPLPYIVVVVDEFADMIMVVGKKVEELIARIAQKARAAGIHLILATQRPSVDVITGLIKANIPSRIGMKVSSKIDSRTILDQPGAESLLGHGDMLFLGPGTSVTERVHGAFVDDHEVNAVVAELKLIAQPEYIDEILDGPEGGGTLLPGEVKEGENDALYDEAVAIVTADGKVSISYLQRRLKIGYNRSARIVEEMEVAGVISEMTNGVRTVFANKPPEI